MHKNMDALCDNENHKPKSISGIFNLNGNVNYLSLVVLSLVFNVERFITIIIIIIVNFYMCIAIVKSLHVSPRNHLMQIFACLKVYLGVEDLGLWAPLCCWNLLKWVLFHILAAARGLSWPLQTNNRMTPHLQPSLTCSLFPMDPTISWVTFLHSRVLCNIRWFNL